MAGCRNTAHPAWPTDRFGLPRTAERNLRALSHLSLLVFAGAAVAAGAVAVTSWSSEFGVSVSWVYLLLVVGLLLPLLCGHLLRESWRARKHEKPIRTQQAVLGNWGGAFNCGAKIPAGLLIVSPDLRVRSASQKYLDSTLQGPEEVLGWKIQDALSAEGIEAPTHALLHGPDPAASCRFAAVIGTRLSGERLVHITMARIAPRLGEDRILVIIEDLLPSHSPRPEMSVEGYAC